MEIDDLSDIEQNEFEIKSRAAASENYLSAFNCTNADKPKLRWIIDSGATNHMTGDDSIFQNIVFKNDLGDITIADGKRLKVEGLGTVTVTIQSQSSPMTLRLDNVAFVPELKGNLISVKALNDMQNANGMKKKTSNASDFSRPPSATENQIQAFSHWPLERNVVLSQRDRPTSESLYPFMAQTSRTS